MVHLSRVLKSSLLILVLLALGCSNDEEKKNTAPTPPELVSPSDIAKNVLLTPTLTWSESTDAEGDAIRYTVYLDTVSKNLKEVKKDLNAVSYNTETLFASKVYYWQVKVRDVKGAESVSSLFRFTTKEVPEDNTPPTKPNLLLPEDGVTGEELNPKLSWSKSSDAQNDPIIYDVYLGKSNPPTKVISSGDTVTTVTVGASLPKNTVFYWQVVAKDRKGGNTPSDVWQFTTENGQPNLNDFRATVALDINGRAKVGVFFANVQLSYDTIQFVVPTNDYYVFLHETGTALPSNVKTEIIDKDYRRLKVHFRERSALSTSEKNTLNLLMGSHTGSSEPGTGKSFSDTSFTLKAKTKYDFYIGQNVAGEIKTAKLKTFTTGILRTKSQSANYIDFEGFYQLRENYYFDLFITGNHALMVPFTILDGVTVGEPVAVQKVASNTDVIYFLPSSKGASALFDGYQVLTVDGEGYYNGYMYSNSTSGGKVNGEWRIQSDANYAEAIFRYRFF